MYMPLYQSVKVLISYPVDIVDMLITYSPSLAITCPSFLSSSGPAPEAAPPLFRSLKSLLLRMVIHVSESSESMNPVAMNAIIYMFWLKSNSSR